MIAPVTPGTQDAALEYLARSPYLNVFIAHVLLHDSPALRRNVALAFGGDRVIGVAYYGRQIVIAADDAAIPLFGEHAKRHPGERMIVGPREIVRRFWSAVEGWHTSPRLVRDRQHVMMVDREHLRPFERRVAVRRARPEEWSAVAESSAAMIRQELAYDPRRGSEFGEGIRQMIERKLWWVGRSEDALCFFCNIGPWNAQTVQLQGIWTPPDLRGRGLATAALAAVCERLFEVSPTISLYVNDFNDAAIALYRRVGFREVGEFQTILF